MFERSFAFLLLLYLVLLKLNLSNFLIDGISISSPTYNQCGFGFSGAANFVGRISSVDGAVSLMRTRLQHRAE